MFLPTLPLKLISGSPEEQVVARVHPIRSTASLTMNWGWSWRFRLSALIGTERDADRVRRGGRENKRQAQDGLRRTFHGIPRWSSSNGGCSRCAKQHRLSRTRTQERESRTAGIEPER